MNMRNTGIEGDEIDPAEADRRISRMSEFIELFEARVLDRGFVGAREIEAVLRAVAGLRRFIGARAAREMVQDTRVRLRLMATSLAQTREVEPVPLDMALERVLNAQPHVD